MHLKITFLVLHVNFNYVIISLSWLVVFITNCAIEKIWGCFCMIVHAFLFVFLAINVRLSAAVHELDQKRLTDEMCLCLTVKLQQWIGWVLSQVVDCSRLELLPVETPGQSPIVHCVSKKGSTLKRYSSKLYGSILMIFGRNIQKSLE